MTTITLKIKKKKTCHQYNHQVKPNKNHLETPRRRGQFISSGKRRDACGPIDVARLGGTTGGMHQDDAVLHVFVGVDLTGNPLGKSPGEIR